MARQRNDDGKNKRAGKQARTDAKPSNEKKTSEAAKTNGSHDNALPVYQKLLDCIHSAYADLLSPPCSSTLQAALQEVKGHLYERNFLEAFSRQKYLEAYTVRWSASRALGYLHIFQDVLRQTHVEDANAGAQTTCKIEKTPTSNKANKIKNILCLGGGAAELCALAGYQHFDHNHEANILPNTSQQDASKLSITLVDVADWSPVTTNLSSALTLPRKLSPYASAAAKVANVPFVDPAYMTSSFRRLDVLQMSLAESSGFLNDISEANLVTVMFTLNELYSASLSSTQRLLLKITKGLRSGALLLVVDSPGSYSTVTINGSEKRYPMSWLLNHTLTNVRPHDEEVDVVAKGNEEFPNTSSDEMNSNKTRQYSIEPAWEKLISNDSEWFRLPTGLRYPLELENMRYQIHLYRRT